MSKDRERDVAKADSGKPVASRAEIDAFLAKVREMAPAALAGSAGASSLRSTPP
jgi:hypothetical protein